jgi:hypothetical protein
MEVTRGGAVVRTARFMASRVLALVEHPASDGGPDDGRRPAGRPADEAGEPVSMVDDAVDRTISQLG